MSDQQPEPEPRHRRRSRSPATRPTQTVAALALAVVTGGAVTGLIYDMVVNQSSVSASTLGLLATTGMGALAILSGARKDNEGDNSDDDADNAH